MKPKMFRWICFSALWLLAGMEIQAQSMYPSLPSSIYYNMDTSSIILAEEPIPRTSYTREELMKMMTDNSWDPDSAMFSISYEESPCTRMENVNLRLIEIKSQQLKGIVSEIIGKTLSEGYSISPDSLISRGVFFRISFYENCYLQTKNIGMHINVTSNYYLGTSYENIRRYHPDSNIYCCYLNGILGLVTFSNDIVRESTRQFFLEMTNFVAFHLYKKQIQKIPYNSNSDDNKDVHSNEYGLYRNYRLDGVNWVESYSR